MRRRGSRVLTGYIRSFVTIVLSACITLGLLLLVFSITSMRRAEHRVIENQLTLAVEDLDLQFDQMNGIAALMKTKQAFQPFYLDQNPFYHLELLESFDQFKVYSPLLNEYYLAYFQEGHIFSGANHWYPEAFFSQVFFETNLSLWELLQTLDSPAILPLAGRPHCVLYAVPLHFGASKDARGKACFLVVLNDRQMTERISAVSGLTVLPDLHVAYNDQMIFSASAGQTMRGEDRIQARLQDTPISLSLRYESGVYSQHIAVYQSAAVLIILTAIAIFAGLSVYAAIRRYRPIRRLHATYAATGEKTSDELKDLERLIASSLDDRLSSQEKINAQMERLQLQHDWLRQQQALLIINGGCSEQVLAHMNTLGVNLSRRLYAVLYLHAEGDLPENLDRQIEELSSEEMTLCLAKLPKDGEYVILVNLDEKDQLNDAVSMVTDILDGLDARLRLHVSELSENPAGIPQLTFGAMTNPPLFVSSNLREMEKGESGAPRESTAIACLLDALDACDAEKARNVLEDMLRACQERYPSLLLRSHYIAEVWKQLLAYAVHQGVTELDEANFFSISHDMRQVFTQMSGFIDDILAVRRESSEENAAAGPQTDVSAYIERHALENNISLVSVADAFSISTRQVGRILKNEGKPPFREYVIALRIDAAKRLLRAQGASVAETAEKTGFNNVSHFVRSFRENTGITPGEYKKNAQ